MNLLICHLAPALLELLSEINKAVDEDLFDLLDLHLAGGILASDLLQLIIILKEETKVLIRYIDVEVHCAIRLHATEGEVSDLVADLLWVICKKDGRVGVTTRHLGTKTLKGWEEDRVVASCFLVLQLLSHISCHAEVRILIDRTRDQRRDISTLPIDVWEGVAEGWD